MDPPGKVGPDTSLLNAAQENAEAMITEMHDPPDGRKPCIYAARAYKDQLNSVCKKEKQLKNHPLP